MSAFSCVSVASRASFGSAFSIVRSANRMSRSSWTNRSCGSDTGMGTSRGVGTAAEYPRRRLRNPLAGGVVWPVWTPPASSRSEPGLPGSSAGIAFGPPRRRNDGNPHGSADDPGDDTASRPMGQLGDQAREQDHRVLRHIAAIVAILIASWYVGRDSVTDAFTAERAWLYVTIVAS